MKEKIELLILYKRIKKNIECLKKWLHFLYKYSSSRSWYDVRWIENIETDLKESIELINEYNRLKPTDFPFISIPPKRISSLYSVDDATAFISKIIRRLEDADYSLSLLLEPQLSENEKQRINSLRNELEEMEEGEYDFNLIQNLKEALKEAESNHYLASSMISARAILYCIEQIKGKSDEDKLNKLITLGIIPKDEKSKETSKWFLKAVKSARHAISHKISLFPSPSDMFSILGDTFKIVKLYHRYEKVRK